MYFAVWIEYEINIQFIMNLTPNVWKFYRISYNSIYYTHQSPYQFLHQPYHVKMNKKLASPELIMVHNTQCRY